MIQLQDESREAERVIHDAARQLRDVRRAAQVALRTVSLEPVTRARPFVTSADLDDDRYTFSLPGLRVTEMSDDLAPYFGSGSEEGLLVLEAHEPWSELRAGDVILKVNGQKVRKASALSVSLDPSKDNDFEMLRKGKQVTVMVRGR
jgi:S1-C subfamily serine protease